MKEVKALFGMQPITVVLVEYYVEQLWQTLDQTVEHWRAGVGSHLPETEDDSVRLRKGGTTAMKVGSETLYELPSE